MCVLKCETRWESAIKLWFSDDYVFDDVIHLKPYILMILILIRVRNFCHRLRLVTKV